MDSGNSRTTQLRDWGLRSENFWQPF